MSTDDRRELVGLLTLLAERIEDGSATATSGFLRRAARLLVDDGQRLAELERSLARRDPTCPCGAAVEQPSTGRRRKYCSPRCRKRAARQRDETGTKVKMAS